MKKMMIALISMLTFAATGNAMSYEQARNEALFLTDKMAYELNLTQEQYEAAYEINLDYLMGVTSYDDVYALGWERRNADLSYILFDWQMSAFRAASYFYRPLYWHDGFWHFGVYARYPRRDYFYFGRPVFYASYRGGHSWRMNGNRSWYQGRRHVYAPSNHHHFGMKDGWDRGDFHNNRYGMHNSSTRTTVNNRDWRNNDTHHRNWNKNRDNNNRDNNRNWNNNRDNSNRDNNRNWNNNRDNSNRSLGGYRSNSGSSNSNRSWTNTNRDNNRSTFGRDNNRTISSGNHSFGSGTSRSVGSGSSNNGGGRSTGGGHSYGGRR